VVFPITYLSLGRWSALWAVLAAWAATLLVAAPNLLAQEIDFHHCKLVSQPWLSFKKL